MFNGLGRYYSHHLQQHNDEIRILDEAKKKQFQESLAIFNSNKDDRDIEVMKIFDCDPQWPICLYDFTYKNKSVPYLNMKVRRNLSDYIVDDYIPQKGKIKMVNKRKLIEDDNDVVREHQVHLCCQHKLKKVPNLMYKFRRNFKILYLKEEDLLFKNPNLNFQLEDNIDINRKQENFILEIAGEKPSGVVVVNSEMKDGFCIVNLEEKKTESSSGMFQYHP